MSTYTIKSGDTLSQIAADQGVSISSIQEANPSITDVDKIFAGASLTIPGTQTAAPTGITTSSNAEAQFSEINESINNIQGGINNISGDEGTATGGGTTETVSNDGSNPFTALFERINALQTNLNAAREKEQAAKDSLANDQAAAALSNVSSSTEGGGGTALDASGQAITNLANETPDDILVQSIADAGLANLNILDGQMTALDQYRQQYNEYTQQDIDSIARTAERSVTNQAEENERTTRAIRFAGVVGGRAQFAPVTEQTIISEVIQDGLDKIEVINEKKNTAIRNARIAEADFNLDVFQQQSDLAKDYNDEIEKTFSEMNAQVRQAELDERNTKEFNQAQAERSSIILAGELVDATQDEIAKAAVANGIDYALLNKAVNDAKFEQEDRDFTTKSNALTLAQKRATLNNTLDDGTDDEDGDFDATDSALLRQAGLEGATNDEKIAFLNLTPSAQNKKIIESQKEVKDLEDQSIEDVISEMVGDSSWLKGDEFPDNLKAAATSFGINPKGIFNDKEARNFLGTIVQNLKTTYPDITDAEIKEYIKDIPEDATSEEISAYLQFARAGI